MGELPKTEEELQAVITEAVTKATETLTAKHNSDMANLRKKHESDLEKAKNDAKLTTEELAKQKAQEEIDSMKEELNTLRAEKKANQIEKSLAENNLPNYLKNDRRLYEAKDDKEFADIIKVMKKEVEATQPQGNPHSSVVTTAGNGTTPNPQGDSKGLEEMGQALQNIIK